MILESGMSRLMPAIAFSEFAGILWLMPAKPIWFDISEVIRK
jgi:hypothetical protein